MNLPLTHTPPFLVAGQETITVSQLLFDQLIRACMFAGESIRTGEMTGMAMYACADAIQALQRQMPGYTPPRTTPLDPDPFGLPACAAVSPMPEMAIDGKQKVFRIENPIVLCDVCIWPDAFYRIELMIWQEGRWTVIVNAERFPQVLTWAMKILADAGYQVTSGSTLSRS